MTDTTPAFADNKLNLAKKADDKLNLAENLKLVLERVENISGKEENAGSPFPKMFSESLFLKGH